MVTGDAPPPAHEAAGKLRGGGVLSRSGQAIPIMSWCPDPDPGTMEQVLRLSSHPKAFHHVALMPDCHPGYGMPIGGVVAARGALIPGAVGVDIGCGMSAVRTPMRACDIDGGTVERVIRETAERIPVGEGCSRRDPLPMPPEIALPSWLDSRARSLAMANLGTLGGGNHFIEIQAGDDGFVWLMIHTGSRNLGYRIARHHCEVAVRMQTRFGRAPEGLAFLPDDSDEGILYARDMETAMAYARANRSAVMEGFALAFAEATGCRVTGEPVSIHHNYASLETHFGTRVWVHRKGATSARDGETGIVPGSMGTTSYIVRGLGSEDSFMSCSHGAGRVLGRREALRRLSVDECRESMRGVVYGACGRNGRLKGFGEGADISEAPAAYRDIDEVMRNQKDLTVPVVRLRPLGVLKG